MKNITSINILCGLIILIMAASVAIPVYRYGVAFGYGLTSGLTENASAGDAESSLSIPVDVAFSPTIKAYSCPPDSISMADGENYPMILSRTVVFIKGTDDNMAIYVVRMLLQLAAVVLTLVLIVAVIRFVVSINRGLVFESPNVKRLARIGWLLLLIAAVQVLHGLLSDIIISGINFHSDYYRLEPNWTFPLSNSILGLFSLMFAAIWKRGIALQRDQELTI